MLVIKTGDSQRTLGTGNNSSSMTEQERTAQALKIQVVEARYGW